jgi:hypothetical protein
MEDIKLATDRLFQFPEENKGEDEDLIPQIA